MQLSVERPSSSEAVLEIELEPERVREEIERSFKRLAGKVTVPGFRRGKAPRKLIERQMGKERLLSDALDALLPAGYQEALQEADVEPLDHPQIEVLAFDEDGPLKFRATVPVKPEVELGDYKSVRDDIEQPEVEVSDDDIQENIEMLQDRMARLVPADEQVAATGNHVVVDSQVLIKETGASMDKVEGQTLELGGEGVYPEVTAALEGATPGETRSAEIKLGDEFPDEELRGKTVEVTLNVHEIKERQLPELDDEFARQVGGFDTVQELRDDLKNRLLRFKQDEADRKYRDEVVEAAVAACEVEAPAVLVDRYQQTLVSEFERELSSRQLTREQYESSSGQSREETDAQFRERAALLVKTDLVLEAIARAEDIKAESEDIDVELAKYAQAVNKPVAEVRKMLLTSDRLGRIMETIARKKTVALLAYGSADSWREREREQAADASAEAVEDKDSDEGETEEGQTG